MYLTHFGLREFPFGLTPDTSYFFPGAGAQTALNTLLVALESGEGLIKIVGEVGSGKTLLCRYLLNQLEKKGWAAAYIPNPHLTPAALNQALLSELVGADASPGGSVVKRSVAYGLTKALEMRLLELAQAGKPALALIDEAQAMPLETMEALRLITNLETEKRKLLQIVLFGQPELDTRLADPSVRQIRSRIVFHERITPLAAHETPVYLMHRVAQAGAAGPLFTLAAAKKLHRLSQGMPRLLNILAHKTLLLAYGEGRAQAEPRHARLAARDTPGARLNWLDAFTRLA
ncbi:MAG: AAA family ATPase [Hydrogenophilales bacterium 28-61-23]|nr:MAG: AAA family ATPase [Hydrogenophilales bacterium 28-61-23]